MLCESPYCPVSQANGHGHDHYKELSFETDIDSQSELTLMAGVLTFQKKSAAFVRDRVSLIGVFSEPLSGFAFGSNAGNGLNFNSLRPACI